MRQPKLFKIIYGIPVIRASFFQRVENQNKLKMTTKTKNWKSWSMIALVAGGVASTTITPSVRQNRLHTEAGMFLPLKLESIEDLCYSPKGCVFRTLFGEERSELDVFFKTTDNVDYSIRSGLKWIVQAQHPSGGWGAGAHARQHITDPHAVAADPATTAMVAMTLLRTGTRLESGPYHQELKKSVEFLLAEVENTPPKRFTITELTGTQIQAKLGTNIDAVLALQFFSNLMEHIKDDTRMSSRVTDAMNRCAAMIQELQDVDGSFKGAGWAGVLQSALANNALESAMYYGAEVDADVLQRSREYQKKNYDPKSGKVNTSKGAGIMLYSVSGSVRASAKQARKVREEMKKAKEEGRISADAPVTAETLRNLGYDQEDAMIYSTSYAVYESSKDVAQDDGIMQGFGNNGGEEFLSYLQTGESLIINGDESWKAWYDKISGRLISIQNEDGSWSGHHCITSPVFCTATTLLTLSIDRDAEQLSRMGGGSDW